MKNRNSKGQFLGGFTEENSLNWKGEKVGYVGLHVWIKKWKGKPDHCERCGTREKRMYHWANLDHSYERILDDYISLCVSCHRKFDYENNNYAPKGRKLSTD